MGRMIGCVAGLALGMGLASVALASEGEPAPWEQLFFRFHPMLVHFPIALLLVALLFELAHTARRRPRRGEEGHKPVCASALWLLAIGATFAALSAWSGWENAEHEYASATSVINIHRWLGIALAGSSALALVFGIFGRSGARTSVGLYRTMLVLSALLVVATGHYGGSIVRGEAYILDPLKAVVLGQNENSQSHSDNQNRTPPLVVQRPSPEIIRASFERDIKPILDERCIECHGEQRPAARLSLHTWEHVQRIIEGRSHAIVAGLPDSSEIYHRVSLPEDDLDLMPADDSGRLSEDQIATIRSWIASLDPGATPSDANQSHDESHADGAREDASSDRLTEERAAVEAAMTSIRDAGGYASHVSLQDDGVVVNLSMLGERADDKALAMLDGLEHLLVDLDLGGTSVTDSGVSTLARFQRLLRLDLSKTQVTNEGVAALAALPNLATLNLYGTSVDDGAIETLASMLSLESLYLWDSGFTADGVATLRERRPTTNVDFGEIDLGASDEPDDG